MPRKKVAYIYPYSFHYRVPFNEKLREILGGRDIEYNFIYSSDPKFKDPRGDLVSLDWASDVPCHLWKIGGFDLRYQRAFKLGLQNDLIIVQQENGLLVNYALIAAAKMLGKKTAYFGHGKNFRSHAPNGLQERFRNFWIDKVDWWFAYTRRSADIVAGSGFPAERITVFNNAVDTSAIQKEIAEVSPGEISALRDDLVQGSENVGIYVGGLYPEKRIDFLIEAARRIRIRIPDFHLLIIGGGADRHLAENAAADCGWIHYMGPRFGMEKTRLVLLGKTLLMPGLVGLAALDSFAYGTPMVTTNVAYHSPEFDYLEDGVNSIVVSDPSDVAAYADAVAELIGNRPALGQMKKNMSIDLQNYSIERMADFFADGVIKALAD